MRPALEGSRLDVLVALGCVVSAIARDRTRERNRDREHHE
jgi:hypothetical protein